ncbi:MAG: serine/threonine protein kinase, partial [Planctomycetes bacterium]|nr:serine/threonine protein kinase [Planctomycetota bacterium]
MSPGLDGRRFGRYEVIEELGHGGQGSVYRARDTQLGRDVALKILGSGAALSEAARLRFLREAEVASRLDHPGLCAVYEFGEHEGVPFIAMRYVRGRPLDRDIADTRASASSPTTEYFDFDDEADDPERSSPDVETMSLGRERHDAVLRVFELVARALHVAHEAGLVHRDIKPANIMIGDDDQPVVLDFGLAREESGDGPLLTATG